MPDDRIIKDYETAVKILDGLFKGLVKEKEETPEPAPGQIWFMSSCFYIIGIDSGNRFRVCGIHDSDYVSDSMFEIGDLGVVKNGEYVCSSLKEFIDSGRKL